MQFYVRTSVPGKTGNYSMSWLAFLKHLAIAGMNYAPTTHKLFRLIGMYAQFSYYMNREDFRADHFSSPPDAFIDPTEKAHFSNLTGLAFADFLSKRISNAHFTVKYEASLKKKRIPLTGCRPDLLAFISDVSYFSIEAKGLSTRSIRPTDLSVWKRQAQCGAIQGQFSMVSVVYNMYNQVKCIYEDPDIPIPPIDKDMLRVLSKNYYSGLNEFVKEASLKKEEIPIKDKKYFAVSILEKGINLPRDPKDNFKNFILDKFFENHSISLLLPADIQKLADNGITKDTLKTEIVDTEYVFIDTDNVGIMIK